MGNVVGRQAFFGLRDNVYVLRDPMFPLYVIRGEKNLLIDCGILAKAREIERALGELLGSEKIDMALITHSHYDHVGACTILQEKYGFEIIASQRTKEVLENAKAVDFINDLNQKFKAIMNDRSDSLFTMPRNIRVVKENETLLLPGGRSIEVYETPGHTRCSTSFRLMPANILFPGDAAGVVETNGRIKPLFLSSYAQYERSLQKLITLNAGMLAPPHNNVIRGEGKVREFLSRSLHETRELKEKITIWLKKTDDPGLIAEKLLAEEYFSPTIMGPREALLINVTAMVKSVFHEFVKKV
jgi:glyoxylase-like metal-dependent hydrolase (beta-lactamase superfamily II)